MQEIKPVKVQKGKMSKLGQIIKAESFLPKSQVKEKNESKLEKPRASLDQKA